MTFKIGQLVEHRHYPYFGIIVDVESPPSNFSNAPSLAKVYWFNKEYRNVSRYWRYYPTEIKLLEKPS